MANKPALKCENCCLNVHENSCKDQTFACVRNHHHSSQQGCNGESFKEKSSSLPGGPGLHLKPVTSGSKDKEKRALSVPPRAQQAISVTTPAQSAPIQRNVSPSRVISEGRSKEQNTAMDDSPNSSLFVDNSGILDALSASMESLEDSEMTAADLVDDDPELLLSEHEPEAWSVTVDKKTLKKMTAKNIKRQDHIWEFIQTEKSHYRTLKIMQRIFAHGMIHELNMTKEMVDRIFPKLEDLIEIHVTFLRNLVSAQKRSHDKSIEEIGPALIQQFDGRMAQQMKLAYGEFCSKHNEAMQLYKDLLKSDIAFQAFIKKCSRNYLCKRLGIPECILLVTQRMTKYPLLMEPIIKTTTENSRDRSLLMQCLASTRDILSHIDLEVDAHEKEQRLFDIYNRIDARSSATMNGKKFKKSDVLSNKRKLLFEGHIKWMSARGKPFEVLAVLLSDVLFFLAENNQKTTFYSQDNKSSVVPLMKLLIREKGDTRDSKGLYLIVQSKTEPEMYEFVCKSADDRKVWIKTIREAIANCPEEGEPSESEEERKLQEAIGSRLRQLIDHLHQKDHAIHLLCEDKMSVALEIMEIFSKDDISLCLQSADNISFKIGNPAELFPVLLNEVTRLFSLMQPATRAVNVIRSFSSAGEHETGSLNSVATLEDFENSENGHTALQLPKRAETFSGFEGRRRRSSDANIPNATTTSSLQEKQISTSVLRSLSGTRMEQNDSSKTILTDQKQHLFPKDCNDANVSTIMQTSDLNGTSREESGISRAENQDNSTENCNGIGVDQLVDAEDEDGARDCEKSIFGLTLSKDQCICITRILQCVHKIMCLTARQNTETESVKAHLAETTSKLARLQAENERLSHDRKSSGYHPDKQLEELRSLQSSIQQQKVDLERIKEEQTMSTNTKKDELQIMEDALQKQRAEIRAEKEELQRQKEALQCQIDFFEEQKQKSLRSYTSMTSSPPNWMTSDDATGRSGTPPHGGAPTRPDGPYRTLIESSSHQRSSSDDLLQKWTTSEAVSAHRRSTPSGGLSTGLDSGGFPLGRNSSSASINRPDGRPISRIHSMSAVINVGPGNMGIVRRSDGCQLPVQLLSAANEQRVGQIPQQIPLKLASNCGNKNSDNNSGGETHRGVQYSSSAGNHDARFWHRLAGGSRSGIDSIGDSSRPFSLPTSPQMTSPASSPQSASSSGPNSRQEMISDRRIIQGHPSPSVFRSGPSGNSLGSPQHQQNFYNPRQGSDFSQNSDLFYNRTSTPVVTNNQPNRSSQVMEYQASNRALQNSDNQSNRPKLFSTISSGNLLPMKLAERQRPKSASAATNHSTNVKENIGQQASFPSSAAMQQQQQQQQQHQQQYGINSTMCGPNEHGHSSINMTGTGHSRSNSNVTISDVKDVVYL